MKEYMYRRLLFICICIGIAFLIFMFYTKAKLLTNTNNIKEDKPQTSAYRKVNESNDTGVYEYIDANGNLVVTNKPNANAQKMHLPPLAVYARPMTENDLYSGGLTPDLEPKNGLDLAMNQSATQSAKERFREDVPNINDTGRRIILAQELEHEKNALVSSTTLLEYAKSNRLNNESEISYQNRLQTLTDNVKAHQENIELLEKMLN